MGIKAALLDERGVYLRMDELESEAQLTARHLPGITACDLPSGRYVWIPDDRKRPDGGPVNAYGGAFWELAWLRRVAATLSSANDVAKRKGRGVYESRNPEHAALVEFLRARGLDRSAA